jgi:NRPS condensation-like uncharacterized protein
MRNPFSDAVRLAAGQLPATGADHLLDAVSLAAPRLCYAFELVLPEALPRGLMRDAVRRTVARFPVLGCRYVSTPVGARWVPLWRNAGGSGDPARRLLRPAAEVRRSSRRTVGAALRRARDTALGEPLRAREGSLMRVHRFQLLTGQQRVLLVCHPQVTDPYGWLRVIEELFAQLQQVEDGLADLPAASERANRSLTSLLLEQPQLTRRSVWDAVRQMLDLGTDLRCLWEDLGPDTAVIHQSLRLRPQQLKALNAEVALAGGFVRDALVACVARACDATDLGLCKDDDGTDLLRIGHAVDLRRFARRRPGLGNYTGVQATNLELPLPGTLTALVMQIRPQLERALEQRAALQAAMPLTLVGQVPPPLTERFVRRRLSRSAPLSAAILDLGRLDRRLPSLAQRGVRHVTFYPPAAGFLPITVGVCSWHKTLSVVTAFAREQLADEEMARFSDHLSRRIRELAGAQAAGQIAGI